MVEMTMQPKVARPPPGRLQTATIAIPQQLTPTAISSAVRYGENVGSFPAYKPITGRRAREISLFMKIFRKKADPFFF
ncbi:hypothetical protein AA471_27320 [Salmonella enterica subsp. enterica]|nr:hypothetical protein [Salmonella enterica subsp. enterica]